MTKKPAKAVAREVSQIERLRRGSVALAKAVMAAQIELARRDGYIQRVRESENPAQSTPEAPTHEAVTKLRSFLTNGPDREASVIIDAISPDLLDQVLGKPDNGERSDIF